MFHFIPLLGGAPSTSRASQSLLSLDNGVNILVDIGWDSSFDPAQLAVLAQHVPTISLILLTHPTTAHIGAYAHACKHLPGFAGIPIYATTPVINLGRTLLTDLYASASLAAGTIITSRAHDHGADIDVVDDNSPLLLLDPHTPGEIASYFSRIHALKYSQPYTPLPASSITTPSDLGGLTIAAYAAGHTLGGTIWHIQHGLESIVYAVDWNQARENLFPGAAWLASAETRGAVISAARGGGAEVIEPLRRPTVLVTSVKGIVHPPNTTVPTNAIAPVSRKSRDLALTALIRDTLAQGGKILIPTDSSSRILELAFLLNTLWRENAAPGSPHAATYGNARVYMATKSAAQSVRFLGSMLEWVEEGVRAEVEGGMGKGGAGGGRDARDGRVTGAAEKSDSPLDWRFVKMIERKSQVDKALRRKRPCVLLASDASLEWGFSRQALQSLASDPKNLIILTGTPTIDSTKGLKGVGRQLWELWQQSQQSRKQDQSHAARVVNASDGEVATLSWHDFAIQAVSDPAEKGLYQSHVAQQRQLHGAALDLGSADVGQASPTEDQEVDEDQDGSSSSSDDEDNNDTNAEHQGRALRLTAKSSRHHAPSGANAAWDAHAADKNSTTLTVNVLLKQDGQVHDFDVRGRRGREKVFPFAGKKEKGDEFGAAVKAGEFLRAEERIEERSQNVPMGGPGIIGNGVGKRKWADVEFAGRRGPGDRERLAKRVKQTGVDQQAQVPDNIDALIARATGEAGGTGPGQVTLATDLKGPSNGDNNAPSSEEESDDADDEDDYDPSTGLHQSGPRKVVYASEVTRLEVKCRLGYVEFEGLAERRDLLMLVPLIQPRKVVLLGAGMSESPDVGAAATGKGGEQDEQSADGGMMGELKMECEKLLTAGSGGAGIAQPMENKAVVFVPKAGERLDVSVDTNAWTVKLGRGLVRGLMWKEVKGLGIVGVRGRLGRAVGESKRAGDDNVVATTAAADSAIGLKAELDEKDEFGSMKKKQLKTSKKSKLVKPADTNDAKSQPQPDAELDAADPTIATPPCSPPTLPILDLVAQASPLTSRQSLSARKPIHVGDLRLAALRHLLLASGHLAEFRGEGSLLIDGCVVVRKMSEGRGGGDRVEVEGIGALGGLVKTRGRDGMSGGGWLGKGRHDVRGEGSFYEVRRAVYAGLGVVGGG